MHGNLSKRFLCIVFGMGEGERRGFWAGGWAKDRAGGAGVLTKDRASGAGVLAKDEFLEISGLFSSQPAEPKK